MGATRSAACVLWPKEVQASEQTFLDAYMMCKIHLKGKKGKSTHIHQHAHMCVVSAAEEATHEWREKRKRVLGEMMQIQRV